MIILKARSIDEGFCRVYFGSTNHLYCIQRDRGDVLELLECTDEGEPISAMSEELLPHFYFESKPPQESKLTEDVNNWIKKHHIKNVSLMRLGLCTDVYKARSKHKTKMQDLRDDGCKTSELAEHSQAEQDAVNTAIDRLYAFDKEMSHV